MGHGSAYRGVEKSRLRSAWSGALLLGSLGLVGVPACGRVADEPSDRESVSKATQAVEASTQVIVRQVGMDYEIEVRGQRGLFPRGDHNPALRVGQATFLSYRITPDTLRGAIYSVTAEQFAALQDGAEVRVFYGEGAPGLVYGLLDKSAVEVVP
jgi:hypothetical protein